MEAKVIRWGDDLAVRLTASEAAQLGLHEGQTVDVLPKRRRITAEAMFAEMQRLGPENDPATVDWGPEIIDDDAPR